MTKFSVTKNGKSLSKKLYTWNEKAKTFATKEHGLVLDFTGIDNVTFKTGYYCSFRTGSDCTFKTGDYCTFDTGSDCTFKTGSDCTFNTYWNCTFKTEKNCIFKASFDCTFNTGGNCFVTRSDVKGCTEIPVGKTIKLNSCKISGYTIRS